MATSTYSSINDYIINTPWSAAFISYVMKSSGVNFPYASAHTVYAQSIRKGFPGWTALNPQTTPIQVGDIIVQNRDNNKLTWDSSDWSGASHGDIVTGISNKTIATIGGNLKDSVRLSAYNLNDGDIINNINVFVILRPTKSVAEKIADTARVEESTWSRNFWKETTPAALNTIASYYSAGNIPIPSNLLAQAQTTTSNQLNVSVNQFTDGYVQENYIKPYVNTLLTDAYFANTIKDYYKNSVHKDGNVTYPNIITNADIDGELKLISMLTSKLVKLQDQISALDAKLQSFTPDARQSLVTSLIFSLDGAEMRNQLLSNAYGNPNSENFMKYSHAWRAPNKLAITATVTIPGMSGFRIGEIFWVDRIGENYKASGAFQLFGLTEHIDVSRGWTTELYSRFNAIPKKYISNLVEYSASPDILQTNLNQI